MKRIAVIPNTLRDIGYTETKKVVKYLLDMSCEIFFEDIHKDELSELGSTVSFVSRDTLFSVTDFIIALGGDGTIIEIAVDAAKYSKPIVGINMGTLGFLTQIEKGDFSALKDIVDGKFSVTKCMMLDIEIISENGEVIGEYRALNDLIVTGSSYKMITTATHIDGTSMGKHSADGIIVSTAIGSTAYSLSAGGAVMHPEVDAMIITPICPHTLKARSTVIPAESIVEITIEQPFKTKAVVRTDGNIIYEITDNMDKIRVKKSKYSTLLIKLESTNFFDVLRNKLSD